MLDLEWHHFDRPKLVFIIFFLYILYNNIFDLSYLILINGNLFLFLKIAMVGIKSYNTYKQFILRLKTKSIYKEKFLYKKLLWLQIAFKYIFLIYKRLYKQVK